MKIENFVKLIDGKLQNRPLINSCEQIVFNANRVSRGDIFVSNDVNQIKKALVNGAYAIVYEGDLEILDDEIAWIKTDSIDFSLKKFLRYFLLEKRSKIFYLTKVEFEILKSISGNNPKIIFLTNEIEIDFQNILQYKFDFLISHNEDLLTYIYPPYQILEDREDLDIKFLSLFKISFIYKNKLFSKVKLAQIHTESLKKVIAFSSKFQIDFNLKKINFTSSFYPIFVDRTLVEVGFGDSSKVLIFEKNRDFLDEDVHFLKQTAKWAKVKLFKPKDFKELKKMVKENFNYAVVYGDFEEFKIFQKGQKNNLKKVLKIW